MIYHGQNQSRRIPHSPEIKQEIATPLSYT